MCLQRFGYGYVPEDHTQCSNWRRNADFRSLPVEVWGKLGTKMNSSGNCHLANLQAKNERSSSAVTWQSSLKNDSGERSFLPLGMRHRDHCRFLHSRVSNKSILHVH